MSSNMTSNNQIFTAINIIMTNNMRIITTALKVNHTDMAKNNNIMKLPDMNPQKIHKFNIFKANRCLVLTMIVIPLKVTSRRKN